MRSRNVVATTERRFAIAVVAALCLSLPARAPAAGFSHCSDKLRTLFTCNTGRKIVSVCASPELSSGAGSVQYRFGPQGAPELAYPPWDADWRTVTRSGVMTFAGGGGSYLAFVKGPYRYVVFTAIGKGWGQKAGVVVEKDGKRVASLPCKDKETSELGPDLFTKAGITEDTGTFDLP